MDTISFDDFSKVDVRIGTVIKAEVPEWSHWVIKKSPMAQKLGNFGLFEL